MHCTPELTAFLDARARFEQAQAGFTAALSKLKALDAPAAPERRPTLVGVAPPSSSLRLEQPHITAAALSARPNGRY